MARALQIFAKARVLQLGLPLGGEREVAERPLQDVVEVVRDAPGQVADRLHALRLPQLRLELRPVALGALARGYVGADVEHVRRATVLDRDTTDFDLEALAALARRAGF